MTIKDARFVEGIKSYPVDQVARRVTQPGEAAWEPAKMPNATGGVTWGVCPTLSRVPGRIEDLTGTRRGRMEVVGFLCRTARMAQNTSGANHIWVARCDCGRYEPRKGDKWRVGLRTGSEDRCRYCEKLDQLRAADLNRRKGVPMRVGNLTVLRYAGVENNAARWTVRCDCGTEEIRKAKTLRRASERGIPQMCQSCYDADSAGDPAGEN